MLKIENIVLPSIEQIEAIIRGMRNPKNSWDKTDTVYGTYWGEIDGHKCFDQSGFTLGPNDLDLAERLAAGGPVHGKFRRMIVVYLDITAPLYWWKEFDTYKVGTVSNSCSTMHKIHAKEFVLEDFSCEHLMDELDFERTFKTYLEETIVGLNEARSMYIETKDKFYWWQMIQLLPSSYNQRRTVMLNYEVLVNIHKYRRDHKLDEWHTLCDWIETLPYANELIL